MVWKDAVICIYYNIQIIFVTFFHFVNLNILGLQCLVYHVCVAPLIVLNRSFFKLYICFSHGLKMRMWFEEEEEEEFY